MKILLAKHHLESKKQRQMGTFELPINFRLAKPSKKSLSNASLLFFENCNICWKYKCTLCNYFWIWEAKIERWSFIFNLFIFFSQDCWNDLRCNTFWLVPCLSILWCYTVPFTIFPIPYFKMKPLLYLWMKLSKCQELVVADKVKEIVYFCDHFRLKKLKKDQICIPYIFLY